MHARTLGVPNFWGHGIVNNMTDSVRLAIGDAAPAFSLEDDAGNTVSLGDFAGERVIVYFYPRANTPGCTKEACDFRDSLGQLNGLDLKVVGISPDTPEKLAKFREDHELNFPLLSDPEKSTMRAWGAFGEKKNYGKVVQGVIRSTFIVGADGKIEQAFYNVRATGHVARILRDLE
ncbi:thioredoxin-dependent thiol peroxidase [Corynebacterium canis]